MKNFLTLVALFVCCLHLSAATITWNGTNGNWNNPAKWSTGTIPTAADDVEITGGNVFIPVGYQAFALQVFIHSSAHFTIRQSGSLSIGPNPLGTYGLYNNGILQVSGDLIITDLTSVYAHGIINHDSIVVTPTGRISIDQVKSLGIYNLGSVNNNGTVLIEHTTIGVLISGGGYWNNASGSALHISYPLEIGILDDESGTLFENRGDIEITEPGLIGVYILGVFSMFPSGYLYCTASPAQGIVVHGIFENRGAIELESNYVGIRNGYAFDNHGIFWNRGSGSIEISDSYIGIQNTERAILFKNNGYINIFRTDNAAIENQATVFRNEACGMIEATSWLFNVTGSEFYNYGWYNNTALLPSTNLGIAENHGVMEDNPLTISAAFNNQQVIVRPVTGPLAQGVPVTNFVSIGSWAQHTALGVYSDATAFTSAGTYDQATNTFTPSAAGAGLSYLYIKISRNSSGCEEIFRIDVQNPAPLAPPAGGYSVVATSENATFLLYPNPAAGPLVLLAGDETAEGLYRVQVMDVPGKVVADREMTMSPGVQASLNTDGAWAPGFYFVRVSRDGKRVWEEKVVLR